MWQDIFVMQVPLWEKVARSALIYLVIWALMRVFGKRGLASTNTLDLIVALLLASAVENAIQTDDDSVTGAAVAVFTLVVLNSGLQRLSNANAKAQRLFEGTATTVIEDGHADERGLRRVGLHPIDLENAVRSQNGDAISEISHGVLTPSGQFVLDLKNSEQSANKADVAELTERLQCIEQLLTARR